MKIFDRFTKAKPPQPQDSIEFTDEEPEAIQRTVDRHAAVANADAPEGTQVFVHRKRKMGSSLGVSPNMLPI